MTRVRHPSGVWVSLRDHHTATSLFVVWNFPTRLLSLRLYANERGGTLIDWMHLLSAQKSAAPTAMDATIHGDEGAVSRLNDGGGALTEVTSSSAFVVAPTVTRLRQKLRHTSCWCPQTLGRLDT
jgi:hypothetical protein